MAIMTPANICSEFRKCGIYPYDRNAIKCGVAPQNAETPDGSSVNKESEITFTEEEEKLHQTRNEEGYNPLDENYVNWLEQNHPSDIPADLQPLTQSMPSTSGSQDLQMPGPEPSVDSLSSGDASEFELTLDAQQQQQSCLDPHCLCHPCHLLQKLYQLQLSHL